jgi:hypothetical protein
VGVAAVALDVDAEGADAVGAAADPVPDAVGSSLEPPHAAAKSRLNPPRTMTVRFVALTPTFFSAGIV